MHGLETLQANQQFTLMLGLFHNTWLSVDMTVDLAIGRCLNISHEDAQILTSTMMYGPKIRILRNLVQKSSDKNKSRIIGALNRLQNDAMRNIVTHSYVISDKDSVTFLERSPHGTSYRVIPHRFTFIQWNSHVTEFTMAAAEFWNALDVPHSELVAFAMASVKASKS